MASRDHSLETADDAAVREQLDRLLASSHFRTSRRCQSLLKYVVEAYLDRHPDRVKERSIGFEVFGREPDYDTNQDSVVRTTAAEVRKKLAQYYLEPSHEHEVRVVLPHGSYLPEFRAASVIVSPAPVPAEPAPTVVISPPKRGRSWMVAVAGIVLAIALGTFLYLRLHPSEIDRFWRPILDDRSEVVFCVGQPLRIYMFDGPRTEELNAKMVGAANSPAASADVREKTSVKLSELKTAGDRYFSAGDYMASLHLGEFLGRRGKPFQVLPDRSTGYNDLRGRPAVLIGQFNNVWTMGLTGNLRYYIARNPNTYDVMDRQNPGKALFSASRDAGRPEEYALVSRLFDAPTEKTVIAIAGMTYNGTIAAGEFLTNERYMREAFQNAPANWYQRNIELVLRTTMVAGTAGPPKVVQSYFW
jgi:hypothetical protein